MKETSKYIGIFDSGMGGITVANSLMKRAPEENIVFFGDTANVPYGSKTEDQIIEFVLNNVHFLNHFEIKAIIIGCNTADAVAHKALEKNFPDLKVFGVIDPASKRAVSATKNGKIGLIATELTVRSRSYEKSIAFYSKSAQLYSVAAPKIVPFVESGEFRANEHKTIELLEEYLLPLKEKEIDTLILGCTHYPILTDYIQKILPDVKLISSSDAAVVEMLESLEASRQLSDEGGIRKYYVSGNSESFQNQVELFLGKKLIFKVEHVKV